MMARIQRFIGAMVRFARHTNEDNIPIHAANASFFIMIAAFPAILFLLTMIQFTDLTSDDIISIIQLVVPEILEPLFVSIINDLFTKTTGTLISISVVTAIWSASKGVLGVLNGLNAVYRVKDKRNFFFQRLIAMVYMILLILALVLTLMLYVYGRQINQFMETHLPGIAWVSSLILSFRTIILIVSLTFVFMLIYKIFPDRKAKLSTQLPGAAFTSLGWMLFSYVFSLYVNNFGNYSYLYGSFGTIVITMLWLYSCVSIIFYGGAVNAYLEEPR